MGSKQSKRKNKNTKAQAQKANRETYFAPDRIKHLPSGHYYTAVTNLQEAAVYVFLPGNILMADLLSLFWASAFLQVRL